MLQLLNLESLSRQDRVILAIQAINSNASLSQQRAAALYDVPQSTLST
jgi:predicted XRE-type DNA-binding protein